MIRYRLYTLRLQRLFFWHQKRQEFCIVFPDTNLDESYAIVVEPDLSIVSVVTT